MFSLTKLKDSFSDVVNSFTSVHALTKQLRLAIVGGDELKAIEIYLGEADDDSSGPNNSPFRKGKEKEVALIKNLKPSSPFTIKKYEYTTPMHLASKFGMYRLCEIFLENGGNPSCTDNLEQNCIHALLAGGSNLPLVRVKLMERLLNWKHINVNGHEENVSLNRVDIDGNSAIHHAASSGLLACVEKLVHMGGIISLVNKAQKTCCELAEASGHTSMASILELALVYQPVDESMAQYDRTVGLSDNNFQPLYCPDCENLTTNQLETYMSNLIQKVSQDLLLSEERAESLLNFFDWDEIKLKQAFTNDWRSVLENAKMYVNRNEQDDPDTIGGRDPEFVQAKTEPKVSKETHCIVCGEEMRENIFYDEVVQDAISGTFDELHFEEYSIGKYIDCAAGHRFCVSCWVQYVTVQVQESGAPELCCPGFKCGETLNKNWAPFLLSSMKEEITNTTSSKKITNSTCIEKIYSLNGSENSITGLLGNFRRARIRRFVERNQSCIQCPALDCSIVMLMPRSQLTNPSFEKLNEDMPFGLTCANGHSVCLSCKNQGHAPSSCEQWARWKKIVGQQIGNDSGGVNDVANTLWLRANTRKCPKCSCAIEKDEGCNHMICSKCAHEFCWMCMEKWSLHSNDTGGYFQCNKFVSKDIDDENDNILGDDGQRPKGTRYKEGSSAGEALRLQKQGQRMARFIHHFSRWSAHNESTEMEQGMKIETTNRIAENLRLTALGAIPWLQQNNIENPAAKVFEPRADADYSSISSVNIVENVNQSKTPERKSSSIIGRMTNWFSPSKEKYARMDDDNDHNEKIDFDKAAPLLIECDQNIGELHNKAIAVWDGQGPDYLKFLYDGFDELAKCRQLLKGTYVYAYFVFDFSNIKKRRNWQTQSLLLDRQTVFESLQNELETLVEMLSNVVARKRLRASQSEVAALTRVVRMKRIELEEGLLNISITDALESQNTNRNSSPRNKISQKELLQRENSVQRARSRAQSRSEDSAALEDQQLLDMISMLSELEMISEGDQDGQVQEILQQSLGALQKQGYSFGTNKVSNMGAVPASSGNLSDLPTPPSSAMNLNNSELSETTGTADIEQKETPPKSKSETSSRIVSALESRNNEQIELNQAILMSLRPPSPLKESNEPVDPQSVDLLVEMMNCSAEQANETLKSCGNNLEEAINSLL